MAVHILGHFSFVKSSAMGDAVLWAESKIDINQSRFVNIGIVGVIRYRMLKENVRELGRPVFVLNRSWRHVDVTRYGKTINQECSRRKYGSQTTLYYSEHGRAMYMGKRVAE